MSTVHEPARPRAPYFAASAALASLALVAIAAQCSSPDEASESAGSAPRVAVADAAGVEAWSVVFGVLQHPRCLNCHPAGDAPLQGDESRAHAQHVRRGADGHGLFAMKCATCHASSNVAGAHMPPGAPNWHLPTESMPLVFEGKSSGELCRQMRDRAHNGGKTPEQLFEHMAHDPLVLWGWAPGGGRAPVTTPHATFAAAARTWVDSGCGCPD